MVWTIRILQDGRHFAHVSGDLRAALSVAAVFLHRGIVVEEIDGPDGERVSPEVIRELCGDDADTGEWWRARLRFLSHRDKSRVGSLNRGRTRRNDRCWRR